jgi:hypothetical protein
MQDAPALPTSPVTVSTAVIENVSCPCEIIERINRKRIVGSLYISRDLPQK